MTLDAKVHENPERPKVNFEPIALPLPNLWREVVVASNSTSPQSRAATALIKDFGSNVRQNRKVPEKT